MTYVLPGNRRNQHTKYWLRHLYNDMQSSKKPYLRVLEDSLAPTIAKYAIGMRVSGLCPVSRFKNATITGYIEQVADVIGRIEYLVQGDDGKRYWILEADIQVLSICVSQVSVLSQQALNLNDLAA